MTTADKQPISEYPTVEGRYFLSKYWSINLPVAFKRTIQGTCMVLSRPGLSFFLTQYGNDEQHTPQELVEKLLIHKTDEAQDFKSFDIGNTYVAQYFQKAILNEAQVYTFHYCIATEEAALYVTSIADTEDLSKYSKQICQTIQEPLTREK